MLFKYLIFHNRPISPHLTIYLPQISSISSILHRFSGLILILSLFICIFFNNLINNYYFFNLFYYWWNYSFILFYFNIEIIFYYHFFNGLRFILLNFGFLYNLKFIKYTYILFLFSLIMLIIKFL